MRDYDSLAWILNDYVALSSDIFEFFWIFHQDWILLLLLQLRQFNLRAYSIRNIDYFLSNISIYPLFGLYLAIISGKYASLIDHYLRMILLILQSRQIANIHLFLLFLILLSYSIGPALRILEVMLTILPGVHKIILRDVPFHLLSMQSEVFADGITGSLCVFETRNDDEFIILFGEIILYLLLRMFLWVWIGPGHSIEYLPEI